jgi:hypothetical protein
VISNLLIEGSTQKLRVSNYWLNLFETYCMFLKKWWGKNKETYWGACDKTPPGCETPFFLTWL